MPSDITPTPRTANPAQCRHCKQPMNVGARRCHHCFGHQGWIADQRDPRMLALVFLIIVPAMLVPIVFAREIFEPDHELVDVPSVAGNTGPASSLKVSGVRHVFHQEHDRHCSTLYVFGTVENTSDIGAVVTFRVKVLGENGTELDNFLDAPGRFVAYAGRATQFRIAAHTVASPERSGRIDVRVERAKPADRWDL